MASFLARSQLDDPQETRAGKTCLEASWLRMWPVLALNGYRAGRIIPRYLSPRRARECHCIVCDIIADKYSEFGRDLDGGGKPSDSRALETGHRNL